MSYLLAKDTVNGASGKIFITVDGKNIEVACMRNIITNAEIQSSDMRVIGTKTIQDKQNGAKLTGTGNIYYGTNIFTDMVLDYINKGITREFDIQLTNDEEAMLNYDFNFAYTRVARLQAFNDPAQLGT